MAVNPDLLRQRVATELAAISSPNIADAVTALLVEPYLIDGIWHEDPDNLQPCWVVAANRETGLGIVFAEQAYGPEKLWGLIWLQGGSARLMGDEPAWFSSFSDAAIELHTETAHCCDSMKRSSASATTQAARNARSGFWKFVGEDPPDVRAQLISYLPEVPIYLIGVTAIHYCPWCGAKLPVPDTPASPSTTL